ncbi:Ribonuclease H domain [Sesbania bispinosa]|nr:Ribonuclease H domain [Sesbania bispinosa]
MLGQGNTSVWYKDWTGYGPLCESVPFVNISDTQLTLKDLISDDEWCLDLISTWITPEIGLLFHALTPRINPLVPDRWIWHEAGNGAYSVMAGYQWLMGNKLDWRNRPFANAWVWKVHCPEKVRLFIWLILNKGIPTNEKRFSCNLSFSPSCARCSHYLENTLHCLRDCPHSLEVWLRLGIGDALFFHSTDVFAWLRTNLRGAHGTLSIDAAHDDFLRYLGPQGRSSHDAFRKPCWSPPSAGLVKLNVDGSLFPDSLIMGIGGIFRGSNSKWIVGFSGSVGPGDSLGAEFQAVFHCLHLAWERGFKDLIVESDSLDVIQTLQSGLLVSSDRCSEVLSRIRNLLRRDWNVLLLHVTRAVNKPADWLAKYGARTVSSFSLLEDPPPEVASLLLLDELGSC